MGKKPKADKIISFIGKKGQGMSLASSAFAMRDFYNKRAEKKNARKEKTSDR